MTTAVANRQSRKKLAPSKAQITPADVLFNPELFASYFLKILDKQKQLVPLNYNRAQQHFMSNRTGRDIILKARQLGFSTAVQGELFRRAITSTTTSITMAHDDGTTQKLRRIQDRFWEHCVLPNGEHPLRKYSNATLVTYPEFDSTCVIATAGSKEAGRGDTYTDFHGSEVAFWTDAEKILAGAMQGGNPDIVLESTPNGTGGWFYDRCMEAINDKHSLWKLFFYPWWWDVTYKIEIDQPIPEFKKSLEPEEIELIKKHKLSLEQIAWRRFKKRELKRLFPQEYPESIETCFLVSGVSYFGNLSNAFKAPFDAKKISTHKYSAGLDWGKDNDYTSLTILDVTKKVQVDYLHVNKLPWGEIRRRVAAKCKRWGIRTLVAESNSIGDVNIEELRKLNLRVIPFNTTNESKGDLMSDLYDALHEKDLKLLPIEEAKHEFDAYTSTKLASGAWRLAAAGKGHDDFVISTALAWKARRYAKVQIWV